MNFARRFVFSAAFIAVATTIARAEESWIGRRVMPKAGAKFLDGERKLPLSRAALPLIVSKVDGEKLWVGWGWVERKHVVPANDAVAYYNGLVDERRAEDSWALCKRAAAWVYLEEWDFALEDIVQVIRRDPKNAEAYRLRARICLAKYNEEVSDSAIPYRKRAMRFCDRAIKLDPQDAMAWSIRGDLWFFEVGGREKALADYDKAIKAGGASARTFLQRAKYRRVNALHTNDQEQWKNVVSDLTEAMRLDPNIDVSKERGDAWNLAGNMDNALRDYTAAIELDPKNYFLYLQRIDIYEKRQQWDEVIEDYNEILRYGKEVESSDSWLGRVFLARGGAWQKKGRVDEALRDFSEAIQAAPTDPAGYIHRGKLRHAQGNSKEALADLNKAIKLDSDKAEFYMLRAAIRETMGQFEMAIKDVETVFSSSRKYEASYVTRSELWRVNRSSDKSLKQLDEAVKQNPDNAKGYRERGEYYLTKGERDAAENDFSRAIELAEDDAESHHLLGIATFLNRRYASAFDKAIRLDPKNERYRFNRGVARLTLIEWIEPQTRDDRYPSTSARISNYYAEPSENERITALEFFNLFIARHPKDARAYLNRGVHWQSQRKWEQALADYNLAIRFNPKSAKAHHNRGEVFWEMKQLDKALADFNEAIRLDPKLTHAYRRRGQVWQAKGQLEKALGDYKQAVRPVLQR